MKPIKNTPKKWLASAGVLALLSVLFSSCLKDNNNSYYNPPVAYLAFIQASTGEPPINFFLNNDRVNSNPLNFNDGVDYVRAFTGQRTTVYYNAYTSSQILSDTIHLYQNQNYTLFLTNTASTPQNLLLKDTLKQPTSGNAGVRFVNVSPDAGAVDFSIQGGAKVATNKSFKGYTPFVAVPANTGATLVVTQAGTSTVLATLPNTILNAGVDYTVWYSGVSNTTVTGQKPGINIFANAQF